MIRRPVDAACVTNNNASSFYLHSLKSFLAAGESFMVSVRYFCVGLCPSGRGLLCMGSITTPHSSRETEREELRGYKKLINLVFILNNIL